MHYSNVRAHFTIDHYACHERGNMLSILDWAIDEALHRAGEASCSVTMSRSFNKTVRQSILCLSVTFEIRYTGSTPLVAHDTAELDWLRSFFSTVAQKLSRNGDGKEIGSGFSVTGLNLKPDGTPGAVRE